MPHNPALHEWAPSRHLDVPDVGARGPLIPPPHGALRALRSGQSAGPRFLLQTALLITLAGVLVACGETVTLESGRSYDLPNDGIFLARLFAVGFFLVPSVGIYGLSSMLEKMPGKLEKMPGKKFIVGCAGGMVAISLLLAMAWKVLPGSLRPSEEALASFCAGAGVGTLLLFSLVRRFHAKYLADQED